VSAAAASLAASLDVPYVRQQKQGCGAAAVAMVMQYWQIQGVPLRARAADPMFVYQMLYDPSLRGESGADMMRYLRDHAFDAFGIDADWNDVAGNLARGRPVILCVRPNGSRNSLHFVVAVGLDDDGRVTIHDPARGPNLRMRVSSLDQEWRGSGRWALVAAPGRFLQ
jgi:predicted double-glycine peptidase